MVNEEEKSAEYVGNKDKLRKEVKNKHKKPEANLLRVFIGIWNFFIEI
ncbi:hypothetical protein L0669_03405 [Flavobacterium bizetiae]|nr:hypothetical protein [Flavobacterium bizetiae]UTN04952.1 hypothetical protein L0669_03405 [Flavobacterium bizetiae]